jgi:hypothetical protein
VLEKRTRMGPFLPLPLSSRSGFSADWYSLGSGMKTCSNKVYADRANRPIKNPILSAAYINKSRFTLLSGSTQIPAVYITYSFGKVQRRAINSATPRTIRPYRAAGNAGVSDLHPDMLQGGGRYVSGICLSAGTSAQSTDGQPTRIQNSSMHVAHPEAVSTSSG